ncbi:hypothetical protein FI667_g7726, partial [Globisporangium splendens]
MRALGSRPRLCACAMRNEGEQLILSPSCFLGMKMPPLPACSSTCAAQTHFNFAHSSTWRDAFIAISATSDDDDHYRDLHDAAEPVTPSRIIAAPRKAAAFSPRTDTFHARRHSNENVLTGRRPSCGKLAETSLIKSLIINPDNLEEHVDFSDREPHVTDCFESGTRWDTKAVLDTSTVATAFSLENKKKEIPAWSDTFAQRHTTQYPKPPSEPALQMCCDDLGAFLCGSLCCACCLSAAEADAQDRRSYDRRYQEQVYVQPVVVTTVEPKAYPVQQPTGYVVQQPTAYYVQTTRY